MLSSTTRGAFSLNGLVSVLVLLAILVVFLIVVYLIFKSYLIRVNEEVKKRKGLNLVFFEVRLPAINDVDTKSADQMFTGLIGIGEKLKGMQKYFNAPDFVSFEIVAFRESIKFFVVCPKKIASVVDRQINGTYPTAEIERVREYNLFKEDASIAFASLKLDKDTRIPFKTYEELSVDFLSTLTDVFSKLQEGESAAVQVLVTPAGASWREKTKEYVKKIRDEAQSTDEEGKKKVKKQKVDDEFLSQMEKKSDKSVFYTDVRIVVMSEEPFAAKSHLTNVLSAFDQLTKEGGNRFKKVDPTTIKNIASDFVYRIPRETMILNTSELATVFHFPNKEIKTPHIKWLLSKKLPAADFVTNKFDDDYMYVGKNKHRGGEKEVFIKPDDRLRHFYVIGQTGTGKSAFMGGMMIRDMKLGHGCAYIDPHGSDAEKILQQVPTERVEDVIIFDPSDMQRPVGLNMLEFKTDAQRTLVTNEMLNIFDTLYNLKVTGGPIFEQYFRYSIMLLTEDPESGCTLMEIPKIFSDDGYRAYKISKCKNQEVIDFWEKQAEKAGGEASLKNVTPYIVSKLASFVTNAYMRPIIAQQNSTINFRQIMDEGKILIVKLSKGKIGDLNANLLGMVIIGKILVGALEREDVSEKDRKPFYLYVDEFQNFLTDGIQIILSEARKYRLGLTMGHQFLGQLVREGNNTKIRDAVFGNVGNKAVFRVGEEDAAFLKKVIGSEQIEEADLQQIENGSFYLKMLVEGKPTPAFSCRSWYGDSPYDMIGKPNPELASTIREISRLKYGRDRDLIENEVKLRGSFIKEKTKDDKAGGMFGGFPGF